MEETKDDRYRHSSSRAMSAWTPDELARIQAAQELEIAPVRRDGTLRRPVPIWVVRAGDDLYVRAAYLPIWRAAAGIASRGPAVGPGSAPAGWTRT
jgi:hypothetical protein